MVHTILILVLLVAVLFDITIRLIKKKPQDKGTFILVSQVLNELNCQIEKYETGENDEKIYFTFQGELFRVEVTKNLPMVWIYDNGWTGLMLNDPNADCLKQAINKANEVIGITNFYAINKEKGYIIAHCATGAYFTQNIPDYKDYFCYILNGFFVAHQRVKDEFVKLCNARERQEKSQ